jgi:hypothetical protein
VFRKKEDNCVKVVLGRQAEEMYIEEKGNQQFLIPAEITFSLAMLKNISRL